MKELASADSCGEVMARAWRSRTAGKALLVAGIAAVGVYAVGDLLSGLLYEGYSFKDQVISELTALGSPVRPLMLAAMTAHGLPVAAFGVGRDAPLPRPGHPQAGRDGGGPDERAIDAAHPPLSMPAGGMLRLTRNRLPGS